MKKKIGDLTLKEIIEMSGIPCPWSCTECREKHSANYAICHIEIEYDADTLDLNQEIEVEE